MAAALDRLHAQSSRGGDGVGAVLGVSAFLYTASSLVVRGGLLALDTVLPSASPAAIPIEAVVACFLLDLISGIWHSTLDLSDMGERLRSIVPDSTEAALRVRATDPRYLTANFWQQFVWSFKSHHTAPYPAHDNQERELAVVVMPLLFLTLVQWYVGWLQPRATRVWCVVLGLGSFTQTSHFLAHRRVHLGRASLPPCVGFLQDIHFLLHPSVHRPHHETFDCNFCIWNGWANPIVNRLIRLSMHLGIADGKHIFPGNPYKRSSER
ncbi:hypothetical protein AB1Y20_017769 [Prymnesium parvum]|uniref:Lipid desaturase domain-containing protein n=1 Tax=Prymnesium parvum TaxID=97485 RepID=A0AB34JM62_PRYPA